MLVQQVADTESGIPPSSRVIPDRQPQLIQSHLKEALSAITIINDLVSEGRF
jgi:hypothetical protein